MYTKELLLKPIYGKVQGVPIPIFHAYPVDT